MPRATCSRLGGMLRRAGAGPAGWAIPGEALYTLVVDGVDNVEPGRWPAGWRRGRYPARRARRPGSALAWWPMSTRIAGSTIDGQDLGPRRRVVVRRRYSRVRVAADGRCRGSAAPPGQLLGEQPRTRILDALGCAGRTTHGRPISTRCSTRPRARARWEPQRPTSRAGRASLNWVLAHRTSNGKVGGGHVTRSIERAATGWA